MRGVSEIKKQTISLKTKHFQPELLKTKKWII